MVKISRVRVKICGITRAEDAVLAGYAGADAIGLVFYPPSSRAVTIEQAKVILDSLPAFVTSTALFVDPEPYEVQRVLEALAIDLLQFHGNESGLFCRQFHKPYIKALAMHEVMDWSKLETDYHDARALLLDTYKPGTPGGTGEKFNWDWLPLSSQVTMPIILAGGLTPDNVQHAIQYTQVYGVDVSGGVESDKGIKSSEKIQKFIIQSKG